MANDLTKHIRVSVTPGVAAVPAVPAVAGYWVEHKVLTRRGETPDELRRRVGGVLGVPVVPRNDDIILPPGAATQQGVARGRPSGGATIYNRVQGNSGYSVNSAPQRNAIPHNVNLHIIQNRQQATASAATSTWYAQVRKMYTELQRVGGLRGVPFPTRKGAEALGFWGLDRIRKCLSGFHEWGKPHFNTRQVFIGGDRAEYPATQDVYILVRQYAAYGNRGRIRNYRELLYVNTSDVVRFLYGMALTTEFLALRAWANRPGVQWVGYANELRGDSGQPNNILVCGTNRFAPSVSGAATDRRFNVSGSVDSLYYTYNSNNPHLEQLRDAALARARSIAAYITGSSSYDEYIPHLLVQFACLNMQICAGVKGAVHNSQWSRGHHFNLGFVYAADCDSDVFYSTYQARTPHTLMQFYISELRRKGAFDPKKCLIPSIYVLGYLAHHYYGDFTVLQSRLLDPKFTLIQRSSVHVAAGTKCGLFSVGAGDAPPAVNVKQVTRNGKRVNIRVMNGDWRYSV